MPAGRPPKPLQIKLAEGDARKVGKRKLREAIALQPIAEPGLPPCPERLRGLARETWHFLAGQLKLMQMDRRPYALMLEGLCVLYETAVTADRLLDQFADAGFCIEEPVFNRRGEVVRTR